MAKYMEHFCHDMCIKKFVKGFHGPLNRYMEKSHSVSGWLWICDGKKVPYHDHMPFGHSVLFLVKHGENLRIWYHLLDWIHWNSGVT